MTWARIIELRSIGSTVVFMVTLLMAATVAAQDPSAIVKERQDLMGKLWPSYFSSFNQVARGQARTSRASLRKRRRRQPRYESSDSCSRTDRAARPCPALVPSRRSGPSGRSSMPRSHCWRRRPRSWDRSPVLVTSKHSRRSLRRRREPVADVMAAHRSREVRSGSRLSDASSMNALRRVALVAGATFLRVAPGVGDEAPSAQRGAYVFHAGGCYACHTDEKQGGSRLPADLP